MGNLKKGKGGGKGKGSGKPKENRKEVKKVSWRLGKTLLCIPDILF